ncbi:hypothetical protein T10_3341 [Trichinella papuae]|uniref:Uncharacterized protein n=1 Tax=Trichinella papuae TaxID=268474 RepID=A0A0V1M3I4_9BILA|nr:hypothetical protein T10_5255 [Trichinella papuae]KRZ70890.1 hypothetical protein T10_3341 [Trichinella papuae]
MATAAAEITASFANAPICYATGVASTSRLALSSVAVRSFVKVVRIEIDSSVGTSVGLINFWCSGVNWVLRNPVCSTPCFVSTVTMPWSFFDITTPKRFH